MGKVMSAMEADLETWLAMYERTHTSQQLIDALQGMIDRIEEEADA